MIATPSSTDDQTILPGNDRTRNSSASPWCDEICLTKVDHGWNEPVYISLQNSHSPLDIKVK